MEIKIKRLNKDAIIPKFEYGDDTGFSLYTCEEVTIKSNKMCAVPTGLAFEFPTGFAFQVKNRSGITMNGVLTSEGKYERITVYEGTIDNGYRGPVSIMVRNETNHKITIPKGTKLAQGVIIRYYQGNFVECEFLNESERNDKGFGSTGTN